MHRADVGRPQAGSGLPLFVIVAVHHAGPLHLAEWPLRGVEGIERRERVSPRCTPDGAVRVVRHGGVYALVIGEGPQRCAAVGEADAGEQAPPDQVPKPFHDVDDGFSVWARSWGLVTNGEVR